MSQLITKSSAKKKKSKGQTEWYLANKVAKKKLTANSETPCGRPISNVCHSFSINLVVAHVRTSRRRRWRRRQWKRRSMDPHL